MLHAAGSGAASCTTLATAPYQQHRRTLKVKDLEDGTVELHTHASHKLALKLTTHCSIVHRNLCSQLLFSLIPEENNNIAPLALPIHLVVNTTLLEVPERALPKKEAACGCRCQLLASSSSDAETSVLTIKVLWQKRKTS